MASLFIVVPLIWTSDSRATVGGRLELFLAPVFRFALGIGNSLSPRSLIGLSTEAVARSRSLINRSLLRVVAVAINGVIDSRIGWVASTEGVGLVATLTSMDMCFSGS